MNSHDVPLQSLQTSGAWAPIGPKFWGTGVAFLAVYLALNLLTEWHEFDRLDITLWSPDDGLSLALLIESAAFAPFVFLAAVLVDFSITEAHRSVGVTVAAQLFLTAAYVRLPDVVAFLVFIPAGAAAASFIYCSVLYLGGGLPTDKFFVAMGHCWIGDALGIVTVIPAATAMFVYLSGPRGRWPGHTLFTLFIFVLGMCLGFAALVGVGDSCTTCSTCFFYPSSGSRCGRDTPASRSRW